MNCKPRSIVARLLSHQVKQKIMNKSKDLKCTTVFIDKDYLREKVTIRKGLWEQVKKIRKQNKFAILVYDKSHPLPIKLSLTGIKLSPRRMQF